MLFKGDFSHFSVDLQIYDLVRAQNYFSQHSQIKGWKSQCTITLHYIQPCSHYTSSKQLPFSSFLFFHRLFSFFSITNHQVREMSKENTTHVCTCTCKMCMTQNSAQLITTVTKNRKRKIKTKCFWKHSFFILTFFSLVKVINNITLSIINVNHHHQQQYYCHSAELQVQQSRFQ